MPNDSKPRPPRQIFLSFVATFTNAVVYGTAVTLLLATYYAVWKAGRVDAWPKMLRFVGLQFTPWFMVAYHLTSRFLPDLSMRRAANLLLPALEGCIAVVVMSVLLGLRLELDNPYWHTAWEFAQLVISVVLARLWVRRTFRH